MKILLSAVFTLAAFAAQASAITVTTPVSGAQVSSPFQLTANTSTCGSVPAVSMGYSIDSNPATIVSTSFNAMISASAGPHLVHVKCWGKQAHDEVVVSITVVGPTTSTSAINVTAPVSGAQVNSPFQLMANTTSCKSSPASTMGYSIDDGAVTVTPASFQAMVPASLGTHKLHVKCWGKGTSDQVLLSITVVAISSAPPPTAAVPVFTPAPGQYTTTQTVALSVATTGAVIYYTTDGTTPTTSSPKYKAAIPIGNSTVIQAIAAAPGYGNSTMAIGNFAIQQTAPVIPSNAISESQVQLLPNWGYKHDPGTSGSASGSMSLVSSPTLSGEAAEFDNSYTNWGGEIYSRDYATDPNAKNFVYDAQVWIEAGSEVGNLEMDNNQVIPNGDTVIYAFQCAGTSNTWDYTMNAGTPAQPVVRWMHSSAPCNPASWAPSTWHHVQISYSRDDAGNVTYSSVWLDGVESPINETVPSAFTLGWAHGVLKTNFQVDGLGSGGSSKLFVDNLTIYRW